MSSQLQNVRKPEKIGEKERFIDGIIKKIKNILWLRDKEKYWFSKKYEKNFIDNPLSLLFWLQKSTS